MSESFKITVPEGVLLEHLSGMTVKARNFEIIRLATNDLIRQKQFSGASHSEQPQLGEPESGAAISNDAYSYSSIGINSNTIVSNEVINGTSETEISESPKGANVIFGDDILNMG
jgi:hypothetical protein